MMDVVFQYFSQFLKRICIFDCQKYATCTQWWRSTFPVELQVVCHWFSCANRSVWWFPHTLQGYDCPSGGGVRIWKRRLLLNHENMENCEPCAYFVGSTVYGIPTCSSLCPQILHQITSRNNTDCNVIYVGFSYPVCSWFLSRFRAWFRSMENGQRTFG